MEKFKALRNQEVKKLFLVVWPPLGEEKEFDIDISFGFVFTQNPDRLCVITTDKNDMWTPCLRFEGMPTKVYSWSSFPSRMNAWMKSECESDLETEYYEVTDVQEFSNIIASKVQSIEFVGLENNPEPFGVKVLFDNDYILSTPISDGNTVETSQFNRNDNLLNFERMGTLEVKSLSE